MIPIKIDVEDRAKIPTYESDNAAGADIYAFLDSPITIDSGKSVLIPTGFRLEIPQGYEAQIRPRSGLAIKHNITLMNSPGTIDADYRGEVKVILTNLGDDGFIVTDGMRIAQMVFNKVYRGHFISEGNLSETERGIGGFGHSGV